MTWELHIITGCLVILAYPKVKIVFTDVRNKIHRMKIARLHALHEAVEEVERLNDINS